MGGTPRSALFRSFFSAWSGELRSATAGRPIWLLGGPSIKVSEYCEVNLPYRRWVENPNIFHRRIGRPPPLGRALPPAERLAPSSRRTARSKKVGGGAPRDGRWWRAGRLASLLDAAGRGRRSGAQPTTGADSRPCGQMWGSARRPLVKVRARRTTGKVRASDRSRFPLPRSCATCRAPPVVGGLAAHQPSPASLCWPPRRAEMRAISPK